MSSLKDDGVETVIMKDGKGVMLFRFWWMIE
jgi:hypothetical protein